MAQKPKPDGTAIIALAKARRRRRWFYHFAGVTAMAALASYGAWSRWGRAASPAFEYVTVPARVSNLHETVTATGTLKGLDSVDVGAQTSGRVTQVLVDINDPVKAGQVIAEIDPAQLKSRVDQSRAQVQAADAALRLARATAKQTEAQASRTRELNRKGLASDQSLEAAAGDAERAAASIASSAAQSNLARAALRDAETALSYSSIRAPIDGIVLARLVEPGQTVAASLQSPVLFTVARDLTELQLYVDVDEADVGKVKEHQKATFAVDAWPKRTFPSSVVSVSNLPTTGQSVVTYQAVLSVDNRQRLLRPGMTATATVITSELKGVLVVPNAALRFAPPNHGFRMDRSPGLPFLRKGRRGPSSSASAEPTSESQGVLWLLRSGQPQRETVEVGGSDGEWTELRKQGPIKAGTEVIVDVEQRQKP
ncbi:efflux RND transporter periplasmic adaptor subunit [Myxococcota bacterium]